MRVAAVSLVLLILLAAGISAIGAGLGPPCCCAHCGCQANCQKVCRLVCEEKKVDVVCYGCLCEPFCVPGPSCPSCQHCECVCASCDTKGDGKTPYALAKPFVWSEWIPNTCATIFNKKKLMKKTETVTVSSYKWVVEAVCPKCDVATLGAEIKPGADVPEPPVSGLKLKFVSVPIADVVDKPSTK